MNFFRQQKMLRTPDRGSGSMSESDANCINPCLKPELSTPKFRLQVITKGTPARILRYGRTRMRNGSANEAKSKFESRKRC